MGESVVSLFQEKRKDIGTHIFARITGKNLDAKQFNALIESYIYSGREPSRFEVSDCLDNKPSALKAKAIELRIIDRMRDFVETFVHGMVG